MKKGVIANGNENEETETHAQTEGQGRKGLLKPRLTPPSESSIPSAVDRLTIIHGDCVEELRKLHTSVYPSLLESPEEKALVEYFSTGQLASVDVKTHSVRKIGAPGMIQRLDAAPSAKYFRVTYLDKPFSYILPVSSFGNRQVIIDESGKVLSEISKLQEFPALNQKKQK